MDFEISLQMVYITIVLKAAISLFYMNKI